MSLSHSKNIVSNYATNSTDVGFIHVEMIINIFICFNTIFRVHRVSVFISADDIRHENHRKSRKLRRLWWWPEKYRDQFNSCIRNETKKCTEFVLLKGYNNKEEEQVEVLVDFLKMGNFVVLNIG